MTHSSEEKPDESPASGSPDGSETGIGDEQLPDELVPGEDNPLAKPLDEDVDTADLGMGTPGPGSQGPGSQGPGSPDDEDLED